MPDAVYSASERLDNCPLCHSRNLTAEMECGDYIVSQHRFSLARCASCGFLFTNPRPSPDEIGAYYESQNYLPHTGGGTNWTARVYRLVRRWNIRRKVALANHLTRRGTLLDLGCGTGEFLAGCRAAGWDVRGVEPGESARARVVQTGIRVAAGFERSSFAADSIDLVTMWHVLEHVHDLNGTVRAISEILRPGGCLVVAVPNHTSYDARYYGEYWGAYDVPRHLSHFSPTTIRRLVEPAGLRHESSRPMWFDSVYVSLMAERYQRTETRRASNVPRAFLVGLTSNLLALVRKETCSSQVYVFRKPHP